MVVAVAAGASFMLSEAIDRYLPVREAEVTVGVGDLLDRAEAGTAGGGSEIGRQTPNSPLEYPQAVFSVLFRPTIFDANSLGNAIAAAETTAVLLLFALSWQRVKQVPAFAVRRPYLLFCIVYVGIFTFACGRHSPTSARSSDSESRSGRSCWCYWHSPLPGRLHRRTSRSIRRPVCDTAMSTGTL